MGNEVNYKKLRKFVAPEYVYGMGAKDLCSKYALNYGVKKALVVTDSGLIEAGWLDKLLKHLKCNNIDNVVFSELSENPKDIECIKGMEKFKEHNCNLIIALGGGSVIDCAKGIGILATHSRKIREYEGVDKLERSMPPLICLPSTAGSSADVSQFAIITDTQDDLKFAIIANAMIPDISLLDPELLTTKDEYLTAATGIDALVHAIESYVSLASSDITELYSLNAIKLIYKYLIRAIENPKSIKYREKTLLASLQAGLAFSNASLGAVHAMAHSLGGLKDNPHGECNAILLPNVIEVNYNASAKKYNKIAKIFSVETQRRSSIDIKDEFVSKIKEFVRSCGITNNLSDIGVSESDLNQLSINAKNDPCLITNPKELSIDDLRDIYEKTTK